MEAEDHVDKLLTAIRASREAGLDRAQFVHSAGVFWDTLHGAETAMRPPPITNCECRACGNTWATETPFNRVKGNCPRCSSSLITKRESKV